ncbi:efflux RND transporter permease subunit [Segatella paludivivens]|uniref:efflux RND transporter permease subunit n=1 Tax=Segatella paludivivens TaxID=185294 RepID=UPI00035E8732|nr:efflux RND transporter permease subunit [Segatella paludivivens]
MKLSRFSIILTMVILMIIGAALTPFIDVGTEPMERQGKTLIIGVDWPFVAAKVVEQNITSPIEGLVSSLKGIEKIESNSYFGHSEIKIKLKPETDVSSIRFEISSLLRQAYSHLPKGISYPTLSGGEVKMNTASHNEKKLLLTYNINADMQPDMIKNYVEQNISRPLERISGISGIELTGTTDRYIEITYNPVKLAACGLSENDIADAIRNFIGRDDIIGEVRYDKGHNDTEKIALHLTTAEFSKSLEQMPVTASDGRMFYLNDLTSFTYKNYEPWSYFRVNGMNTIYLNVYVPADAKVIPLSDKVQEEMDRIQQNISRNVHVELAHDEAKGQREELFKLITQTLMSLALLLFFVWLTSRNMRYLSIIAIALAANLLIAIIAYWLFKVQLHIYSLAGVTVSLGLIIDSTIVMADHYSYYHDRKAFQAILAALLTTIGSLIIIFFLPDELRDNLYDFGWIIIINLTLSLLVAYFFVPSLVDSMHYTSHHRKLRHGRAVIRWNRFYTAYLNFTRRRRWIYYILLVLAFGVPVFALPAHLGAEDISYSEESPENGVWYEKLYNETLGSKFFKTVIKDNLSSVLGGSMKLFAESLNEEEHIEEPEKILTIMAQMPLGGRASQLNEKVRILEEYLRTFKQIKTFTTTIDGRGAQVEVKFRDEWKNTAFPYFLENKVISKVITIGGADWSTHGVSLQGFSNALNLQSRQDRIVVSGFNYNQLYRLAEDICDYMRDNERVQDLIIETPSRDIEEDEYYMRYSLDKFALARQSAWSVHSSMADMLKMNWVGHYHDRYVSSDICLKPSTYDEFDLWHLNNSSVSAAGSAVSVPDLMQIAKRTAKNVIHRENQEYVLNIAFNVLGSYVYESEYIHDVIEHFTKTLPIGFKCSSPVLPQQQEEGVKYWLVLLIVVIIFFICTILFESFRATVVIVSIIPVTLIGTFLTFYFTGAEFGAGGFASLVLLCGITVNSGIYIMNQYNILRRASNNDGLDGTIKLFVRAYNHKIIPVFLTVSSTIMGLIPFFAYAKEEPFWFSFATGVTGGLVFSFVAIVFIMPLFVKFKKPHRVG